MHSCSEDDYLNALQASVVSPADLSETGLHFLLE